MKPRRVARELAVIVLSQLPKSQEKLESLQLETLLTRSVESLTDYARQLLDEATAGLTQASDKLNEYELNHPQNIKQVHKIKPVDVSSQFLRKHLEKVDRALLSISEALVIPQLTLAFTEENRSEVRDFAIELLSTYMENKGLVEKIMTGLKSTWRSDRMMSIDRNILRLAVTEMFFKPEIPCPVCINEAVELCHSFADDKAAKFLNGVLADLLEEAEYFRETGELKPKELSSKSKD